MERSSAELMIIVLLCVLIGLCLWGLSVFFRASERTPRRRRAIVEVPDVEVVEEVPRWLPWESEWIGGYNEAINRPKPNFYPGRREGVYRREANEPVAHERGAGHYTNR